jgi:hypothetical protein
MAAYYRLYFTVHLKKDTTVLVVLPSKYNSTIVRSTPVKGYNCDVQPGTIPVVYTTVVYKPIVLLLQVSSSVAG